MMIRNYTLALILGLTVLQGCKKDKEEQPLPGQPPVAVAGPDMTAKTGSTVVLDGSKSTDPDGDELLYTWKITSAPTGSKPVIDNTTEAKTFFKPDLAGSYVVALTVEDGVHPAQTDEIIVTAEEDATPAETVIINQNIDENTVWEDIFNDPLTPDYLITRSIEVNASLTLRPGVIVHVQEDALIKVESGGGVLTAEGTEDKPITFTSANEAGKVLWGGILFNSGSSQNLLNYVNIFYGGGTQILYHSGSRRAAIGVNDNGTVSLRNTIVRYSGEDGLYALGANSLGAFENNSFTNNVGFPVSLSINQVGKIDKSNNFLSSAEGGDKDNVVRVFDSNLEADQVWPALSNNGRLRFEGHTYINARLTIQDGAILEFNENIKLEILETGVIKAKGTADRKIVFTSANIADGIKWGGILIATSSINNELDHVTISHAGGHPLVYDSGDRNANIVLTGTAKLKLSNSEISYSSGYGLYVVNGGTIEAFANNNFHHNDNYPIVLSANMAGMMDGATVIENNFKDVVAISGSEYNTGAKFNDPSNEKWMALKGNAKYFITNLVVLRDKGLEIGEGAYITLGSGVDIHVNTDSYLKAIGTPDKKIMITSETRDGNKNWGGILFNTCNTNNQLEHAEISYGGNSELLYLSGTRKANIGLPHDACLTINHVNISNSRGFGIANHAEAQIRGLQGVTFNENSSGNYLITPL